MKAWINPEDLFDKVVLLYEDHILHINPTEEEAKKLEADV